MEQDRRVLLSTYIRLLDNLSTPQNNVMQREQEEDIRGMSREIYRRFVLGRLEEMKRDLGDDTLDAIDNLIDESVARDTAFDPATIFNLRNKLLEYMVTHLDGGGRKKKYKRLTDNKKSRKKGRKRPKTKTKTTKHKSRKKGRKRRT